MSSSSIANDPGYAVRRDRIETYFDRTAAETWSRLTSDVAVSGIRATVRAGRDRMRAGILSWLPQDMRGLRLFDAGCGTGALAIAAAERGADVVAIDLSPTLVAIARERAAAVGVDGRIDFRSGDMLAGDTGRFDHVVSMDVLIHYRAPDMVAMVSALAGKASRSLIFTFAPRTPALTAMHAVGRLFPRADRAPAIEPLGGKRLSQMLSREPGLAGWVEGRSAKVVSGFYMSNAKELVPA
ncbi:MAG: magnesium protoporphyrin IX methyltransferase [Hyphomicrobiaceae bacterium]